MKFVGLCQVMFKKERSRRIDARDSSSERTASTITASSPRNFFWILRSSSRSSSSVHISSGTEGCSAVLSWPGLLAIMVAFNHLGVPQGTNHDVQSPTVCTWVDFVGKDVQRSKLQIVFNPRGRRTGSVCDNQRIQRSRSLSLGMRH